MTLDPKPKPQPKPGPQPKPRTRASLKLTRQAQAQLRAAARHVRLVEAFTQVTSTLTARTLTLAEVEEGYVRAVLVACEGNRSLAARILGVDRKTLYRCLARWNKPKPKPKETNELPNPSTYNGGY